MLDIKQQEKCKGCSAYHLNNQKFNIEGVLHLTYIFPMLSDIENRTSEEDFLLAEMIETVNPTIVAANPSIYDKLFDKYENVDEIMKVLRGVPVINKFGHKVPKDFISEKINVIDNVRFTTDMPEVYSNTVYIFGKSEIFGHGAEDIDTIASQLQRFLNGKIPNKYRVINKGVSSVTDLEIEEKIKAEKIQKGDIVINIILKRRCFNTKEKGCKYYSGYKELYPFFNDIENRVGMFIDSVPHLNYKGNEVVAKCVFYDIVKETRNNKFLFDDVENVSLQNELNDKESDYSDNEELYKYLSYIREYRKEDFLLKKIGAIVMNCNPFTLGHYYLIQTAAAQVDRLYIFVVEEDKSFFKFKDRFKLVKEGTKKLKNVIVLPSGNFMISSLTFPEYFDKEKDNDVVIDASMDMDIFGRYVAKELGITVRFAGEEPNDMITRQYNMCMSKKLPEYGIDFIEIPRKQCGDKVISATTVRAYLKEKNFDEIEKLVPATTLKYLKKNYM